MTSRQAHEAERIQHRLGRVRVGDLDGRLIAVDVVGDDPSPEARPYVRLILSPNGLVVRRQELAPAPLSDFDLVVRGELRRVGRWIAAGSLAIVMGEDRVDRVSRSLRKLLALGEVEACGISRDRMWRLEP